MKTFVVILAIAAAVSADIGLGYHYKAPQTSYEAPSYSSSSSGGYTGQGISSIHKGHSLNSGSNSYQTSNAGLQNGYPSGSGYQSSGNVYPAGTGYQSTSSYQSTYQSGPSHQSGTGYQSGGGYHSGSGYQPGYQSTSGYQSGTGYQTGGRYQTGSGSSTGSQYQSSSSSGTYNGGAGTLGVSSGQAHNGYQGLNQYQSSSNQYQSNAGNYQQYYNQVQQQAPQIFKHFYVHAAPEEPELPRARQPLVLPAPQKHYKIIFIKTPTASANSAQYIPVQQQNEEKTIVYVLVKKQEAAEDIAVPQLEQKPPSKPEVFFIKYKGKEDSQAVINNIVNEYSSGKDVVNVVGATQAGAAGTLDGISDVKYTSQSFSSGSQSSGGQGQGSSGSFESQSYETSGSSSSGTHSQNAFGVSDGSSGYHVSTVTPAHASSVSSGYGSGHGTSGYGSGHGTSGYDSGHGASSVSSTVSSTSVSGSQGNTIATNQGIPHENYGPPKFREY